MNYLLMYTEHKNKNKVYFAHILQLRYGEYMSKTNVIFLISGLSSSVQCFSNKAQIIVNIVNITV